MPRPTPDASTPPLTVSTDERREWIRIDDHILLEYRLASDPADGPAPGLPPVTPEIIAAAVGKPTQDLLARADEALAESPLLPWIMKVDWLLEAMLKTLAAHHPGAMALARVTAVNLSGGGISFVSPRRFEPGNRLSLKLILPPFSPIHTGAVVTRATPTNSPACYVIATQFQDLAPDDQERIIRHILQTQAERVRARRADHQGGR